MLVLIAYDVSTVLPAGRRRLARVARACADYGVRVQKSVFECRLDPAQWALLRDRLLTEHKSSEDSLRFYFLDEAACARTEHHGVAAPPDLTAPLVL
jgi:CRISPR-associated protein Cas2